jgi:D-sedoheptulose 7-phosphate isomerase
LISSSGKSQNIINSASYCFENVIPFIILSGFDKDNPLKKLFGEKAEIDLHIDSRDYGVVECLHELFLHSIL